MWGATNNKPLIFSQVDEFEIAKILEKHFNYDGVQITKFEEIYNAMRLNLAGLLNGTVFEGGSYIRDEKILILKDLERIVNQQFSNVTFSANPKYITTAGAPGCGKSYFIEHKYGDGTMKLDNAVYVDPDRVGLPSLTAYNKDVKEKGSKFAYEKWRNASNFIAYFLLVKAIVDRVDIIHGTTASNDRMPMIYKTLGVEGYKITIELFFASANQRVAALNHRASSVVQVSEKDAADKVRLIFLRMIDSYFNYAEEVSLYFQVGDFWLGKGQTVNFAHFNKSNCKLSLTSDGELYMSHLKEIMQKELMHDEMNKLLEYLKNLGLDFSKTSSSSRDQQKP